MALAHSLTVVMTRDLAAVRREVEAYPNDQLPWAAVPGLANSGGVLVRHICGNLQHFIGAVLGQSGYLRNREHEFTGAPESRAALVAEVERTIASVSAHMPKVTDEQFAAEYPLPIAEHRLQTEQFLVHLVSHLGFHLGQLDYHRRVVTGQPASIGPMAVPPLARP